MKLTQGLSRRFCYTHRERFANLLEAACLHADIAAGGREAAEGRLDLLIDGVEAFTRATLES
jgi:hypothetical protein